MAARSEVLVAVCAGANSCVRPEVMMEVHRLGKRCEAAGTGMDLLLLPHAELGGAISVALRALLLRARARSLLFLGPDVAAPALDMERLLNAGPDTPLCSVLVASPVSGGGALHVAASVAQAVGEGRIAEEAAPAFMVDFPSVPLRPIAEACADASEGEELGVVCDTFSAPLFAIRREALTRVSPGSAADDGTAWVPALFAPLSTGASDPVVGVEAFFERLRSALVDHLLVIDARATTGESPSTCPSFHEFYEILLANRLGS